MFRFLLANIVLLSLLVTIPCYCENYYVDVNCGSDEAGYGSIDKPYKTISYGLSQVTGSKDNPAEIHVFDGTYNVEAGEVFPLTMKKYVSLVGETRDTTVIDASGANNTAIYYLQVKNSIIRGFTITGGSGVYIPDD